MVRFRCPSCNRKYKTDDEFAGSMFPCRHCGHAIVVPALSDAPEQQEPTSDREDVTSAVESESQNVAESQIVTESQIAAPAEGQPAPASGTTEVVRFRCPKCRRKYRTDREFAGSALQCSRCGETLVVPSESEPASGPPAPAERRTEPKDTAEEAEPAEADDPPPFQFRRSNTVEEELDMTPMVDITFLLLIFFMVTAAFSLQKSIELPTPDATEEAAPEVSIEDVEAEDDFIVVMVDKNSTIWVDGRGAAPSWHELLAKIGQQQRGDASPGSRPRNKMLVLASDDARHEVVVEALDAASAVGMETVRLSTLDEDEP